MKTKDFIKRVEELGFKSYEYDRHIYVRKLESPHDIVSVSKEVDNFIYMAWTRATALLQSERKALFNILVEYASTPIEERKEEKRYYLKHRYLKGDDHLTIGKNNNRVILSPLYIGNDKDFKREFTLKEIKRLKKKLKTDFKDFELIEVDDE